MKPIALGILQRRMTEVISSGAQDPKLLGRLGVLVQEPISIQARVSIYQRAFELRLLESLEDDFPRTKGVLGAREFERLCLSYLKKFPSESWTLADLGRNLPVYGGQRQWSRRYPFLADLTQWEWLRVLADHAETIPQFDFKILSTFSNEQLQRVRLSLSPSVQLQRVQWSVHRPRILPETGYLAIFYSEEDGVTEIEISYKQFRLLKSLRRGLSLNETSELLAGVSPEKVTQWFSHWAGNGILTLNEQEI